MKYKCCYIEWNDALSKTKWTSECELSEWVKQVHPVYQVGWLIKETKSYVIIAPAWSPDNEDAEEQYLNCQKIPRGWIKEMKEIKIST